MMSGLLLAAGCLLGSTAATSGLQVELHDAAAKEVRTLEM
jgi:hypothetical protein